MGGLTSRRQLGERVKFGVPLTEVCKYGIPGPLLTMILRLNKEAPHRKNVFRTPGPQSSVKKLTHFLQRGHRVNMQEVPVHTIASVLKKFLRKVPGGIFGYKNEEKLFQVMELDDPAERCGRINGVVLTLPISAQHILVLFFGTLRAIANNPSTGMTSEALGVSVAPSVFHSCVSNGAFARMEDVKRYKVATRVTRFIIDHFGSSNMFCQENYRYYVKLTGRSCDVPPIRKTFHPPVNGVQQQQEDVRAPPMSPADPSNIPVATDQEEPESEDNQSIPASPLLNELTLEQLRAVNQHAERTKCLSYLPQVHQRQMARMHTRSEWFRSPCSSPILQPTARVVSACPQEGS